MYTCMLLSCYYLRTHLIGLLVAWRSCSSVPDTMREAKRETVEPLENMNWQKEERHCHLHHCVHVHQKKPEWKSFSPFISLTASTPCTSVSITLFSFSSFFFFLSPLCPLAQQLTLHTQEQTEISIHVMPHSLATPTNGSMQLACTHSKRPFEYSSANSCIHWYLKCSGSARVLNPWYIWQSLKKPPKNKDGYRGQGSRQFLLCSSIKYQVASSDWHVCLSSLLRKWKHVHCQCSLRPTDNNLQCT